MYKDNIGLNDRYNFGVEIEFAEANLAKLYLNLKEDNIPIKFRLNHKLYNIDFSKYWCLDIDNTVTKYDKNNDGMVYLGGELSSKILQDNISSWNEIKEICYILRKNQASINKNCSCHINIDASKFLSNNKFFKIFSQLIALYENDFILYYMGDKYLDRVTRNEYAKSIRYRLLKKINNIDFSAQNLFNELLYHNSPTFMVQDGINMAFIEGTELIEIRYPNGTLDEKIIQNNINFSLKLIDAIINDKFDSEKLTFLIDEELKNKKYYQSYLNNNYSDFYKLVETISMTKEDTEDIMNQYEKVLKTRK